MGTRAGSALATAIPASSSARRTASSSFRGVVISYVSPSVSMSSAPASSATLNTSSSVPADFSTEMLPLASNTHATAPASARLPPFLLRRFRSSETVRLRLSVTASMRSATPPGAYPSYVISSYETPSSSPVPRLIARSTFSIGMLFALAVSIARRNRGFASGLPPPFRAAIEISLISFVKMRPRWASFFPFLRFMVAHFECPDMSKNLHQKRKHRKNSLQRSPVIQREVAGACS
ncbi:MAG: hypothetical protein BWY06_02450 [Candidatus Latescibacteria bacterium ADurb.Bin168]|nr:MAG: hypothetical protein BWY06_02450 [Candidatus Latescibacteria bacterium ADurb.Bin168]